MIGRRRADDTPTPRRTGSSTARSRAIVDRVAAQPPRIASPQRSREGLDREEREIKDNVLRMGSLVAEQILAAIRALEAHDARGCR